MNVESKAEKGQPKVGPKKKFGSGDSHLLTDPALMIGYDLAASIIVGAFLGWLCIKYLPATKPWGFIGFLVLGIASGYWQVYKKSRPQPGDKREGEKR